MVRWQKQVFIHTRLSRAYLALARLSCLNRSQTSALQQRPILYRFQDTARHWPQNANQP